MPRHVVHVIDPAGPATAPAPLFRGRAAADIALLTCAEAILATPDHAHSVVVLGSGANARAAAELCLGQTPATLTNASSPLGIGALGGLPLRHTLRALPAADVLVPWSTQAHNACALAGGRTPIAPTPDDLLPVFTTPVLRQTPETRADLGVPEDVPIIALLCDPMHHADTRRFVYLVGILQVAGYSVAGLVDRRAAHTARARRFHAESGVAWRVLVPTAPTAALLHACDIALVLPPAVHQPLTKEEAAWTRWSVLRAHSLGVPVAGAAEWLPPEARPEGHAEFFDPWSGDLRSMIRGLIALATDPASRKTHADAAKEAAQHPRAHGAFADRLRKTFSARDVRSRAARTAGHPT